MYYLHGHCEVDRVVLVEKVYSINWNMHRSINSFIHLKWKYALILKSLYDVSGIQWNVCQLKKKKNIYLIYFLSQVYIWKDT